MEIEIERDVPAQGASKSSVDDEEERPTGHPLAVAIYAGSAPGHPAEMELHAPFSSHRSREE
jgi:hypothetical protein